jgi:hypothetical protein
VNYPSPPLNVTAKTTQEMQPKDFSINEFSDDSYTNVQNPQLMTPFCPDSSREKGAYSPDSEFGLLQTPSPLCSFSQNPLHIEEDYGHHQTGVGHGLELGQYLQGSMDQTAECQRFLMPGKTDLFTSDYPKEEDLQHRQFEIPEFLEPDDYSVSPTQSLREWPQGCQVYAPTQHLQHHINHDPQAEPRFWGKLFNANSPPSWNLGQGKSVPLVMDDCFWLF